MTEKYKDTQVIYLENNYRSSGAILLAAVEVIQQDKARADRPFAATHPVGTRPVMRTLPGAGDEAQWIVKELNRVRALSNSMIRLNDVAILVRSAALSRLIEAELAKAGLPYRMVGGFRFFDRLEIKLILDYLRVINNPDNNDALARIINVPSRKIGDKTVKSLIETAESTKRSIWKLLCDYKRGITSEETTKIKSAKKGILSFVTIISIGQKKLEELGRSVTLVELIECINEEIGLEDHLKKQHDGDYESRLANIEELIQQAAEFSNMDDLREDDSLPTVEGLSQEESISADLLGRYLATVALSSETKVEEGKEPIDQVTISTIHGAKGLEWPVVFIPAVHSGSIPHYRAEEPDEERRLLYVAMTRAKALLYLSRPESDSRKEDTSTSMFVEGNALKRLLDCYGPSLKYGDVQCMGHILGRECPPEPRVSDILDRVPSIEDDFLLAKGKRKTGKRQVSEGSYGIASGRDLNHYAAATATMNTGFVPATSHLHNLDQRKLNPIDGNRKRPASPSRSETDRCVQKTKLGSSKIKPKRAIDSFFGRKGSSTTEAVEIIDLTLSPPPFSKSSRDAPGSQRPGAAPKRHDHYRPPLPRDLSDHRPLARPNAHRPRIPSSESKAYPFLSSPPEATATLRLPEDSLAKNAVLEKPRTGPNPPALSTRVWTHPGSRTLGVRRGMDGWNARGGMGKSTTGTRGGRGG
jgi:DNA helicase-2/ATP-dependent DNA helicase PcrA